MIPIAPGFWKPSSSVAGPTGTHLFYNDDDTTGATTPTDYFSNATSISTERMAVSTTSPPRGTKTWRITGSLNFHRYEREIIFTTPHTWSQFGSLFTWEGFVKDEEYASTTNLSLMYFGKVNIGAAGNVLELRFDQIGGGGAGKLQVRRNFGSNTYITASNLTRANNTVQHWALSVDGSDCWLGLDGVVEHFSWFDMSVWTPNVDQKYVLGCYSTITTNNGPANYDNIRISHGVARYTDTTNGYSIPSDRYTD